MLRARTASDYGKLADQGIMEADSINAVSHSSVLEYVSSVLFLVHYDLNVPSQSTLI